MVVQLRRIRHSLERGDRQRRRGPISRPAPIVRDSMPNVGAVEVGGTLLPAPTSIVSSKIHGANSFGIDIPLTGNGAVECRSGGAGGNHQIVLNFAKPVTSTGASMTKGVGTVSSYSVNGSQVTINFTEVANAQDIFVTLFNVGDGTNANDITVPMGVLLGDVNGNGVLSNADVTLVKARRQVVAVWAQPISRRMSTRTE